MCYILILSSLTIEVVLSFLIWSQSKYIMSKALKAGLINLVTYQLFLKFLLIILDKIQTLFRYRYIELFDPGIKLFNSLIQLWIIINKIFSATPP